MSEERVLFMVNQRQLHLAIDYRIRPYVQEAMVQVLLDILVLSFLITVFVLAEFPPIIFIFAIALYLTAAFTLGYRVLIQAMIDKHKRDVVTETITIKQFKEEMTWFAADRTGTSYIRLFYPKNEMVGKKKITVIDEYGEKKKLRSVMSFKRVIDLMILGKFQIECLEVMYLRRSKILLFVNPVDEIDKKLPKKTRKGIEKALHYVNRSI